MKRHVARLIPAVLLLASCPATGQRVTERPHPGIVEFSRICLAPRTVEFAMPEGEAERLGFTKDETKSTISEEDAARYNVPEDRRTSIAIYPLMPHGGPADPDGYSVWASAEKTQATVQRVDVGRGLFGAPGFAAPATFCSVLTLSDAAQAWSSFPATFPDALYIGETEGMFLGRMRSWMLDLPWAPAHTAIVTISDYEPSMFGRAFSRPSIALFSIEIIPAQDFERMSDLLEAGKPI
jgi:hypothetical protein